MKCSICYGMLGFLGRLGKLDHFRCRDCGMEFSAEASLENEDEAYPIRGYLEPDEES